MAAGPVGAEPQGRMRPTGRCGSEPAVAVGAVR